MILLIDDERSVAPNGDVPDVIVRNLHAAYSFIVDDSLWRFETVYLDHDLGSTEPKETGYGWITQLEKQYHRAMVHLPERIVCVSDNPPGRARINQVIEKLYAPVGKDA